jgi:imidazolonepropionase-like amidohydrolase
MMDNDVKVVQGGTLIDGTGSKPMRNSVIIIENKTITKIGQIGHINIPNHAEVFNATGKYVMPGLIDCHTHLYSIASSLKSTGFGLLEWSHVDRAVRSVAVAKALLDEGITTIRDVGSCGNIDLALRDAINDGVISGPRILGCGEGITCTGGHVDFDKHVRYLAFHKIAAPTFHTVDGVNEVLKAVRQQAKLGADWIKFWASGGILETTERAFKREFSDEEINGLVQEATRMKLPVAVHALSPDSIKVCVEAGVRSVEHAIFSDEESIRMMRENGTFLVPTLMVYELLAHDESLPISISRAANRATVALERTLRMAQNADVPIVMGTDSGMVLHDKCRSWELELMVKKGLTPLESIQAATINAAKCLGLEDQIGSLEPGKSGDLLVIEGNPLEDIRVLQEKQYVKLVMKEGKVYAMRF